MGAFSIRPTLLLAVGCGLMTAGAWGDGPAVGDQFQVNSYTTGWQNHASVAVALEGDFVVVWDSPGSYGTDDSGASIQGQRYASDGAPLGGEFQVNSYTTGHQSATVIAMAADGDFVVAWQSAGSSGADTSGYSIQGQRYSADGTPLGAQFQVNSYSTDDQLNAALATTADGGFVVVWESNGSSGTDTDSSSIQGQRYAADGSPLGVQFQVNAYTTEKQERPALDIAADGDFVVAWSSYGSPGSDTSEWSVQSQRFASDGAPLGSQFQVNSYTAEEQSDPAVGTTAGGDFVVAWRSDGSAGTDTNEPSVQGQRYAADGTPQGGEFQVNSYTTDWQYQPVVGVEVDGDFLIAWTSYGSDTDTSAGSIQLQRYASWGMPKGGQVQVNSYTMNWQWQPAVDVAPGGVFVVAWTSYGSYGNDDSGYSVQAQRYDLAIFADGFESGDTSTWSRTVP